MIRKLFKITRAPDWWEYKIPPILAIAYATMLKSNIPFIQIAPWLAFLLVALTFGAIYANSINDITDIDEDIASGKTNRMAKILPKYRWIIPSICFIIGFGFFCYFLFIQDPFSAIIYALPCFTFSLYSFKPFRLKERKIWGVIADALGAHVFISLLMVSSITFFSKQSLDISWLLIVGSWSLIFGIRGIIWHQFHDRENDLKVNLNTFATSTSPNKFKNYEKLLISIELLLFSILLFKISLPIPFLFLILYLLLALFRYKVLGHKLVIVLNPDNSPLQIFMLDYYQVFFPLALLLFASITQDWAWCVLFIHLILFHNKLFNILTDCYLILRQIFKKRQKIF